MAMTTSYDEANPSPEDLSSKLRESRAIDAENIRQEFIKSKRIPRSPLTVKPATKGKNQNEH